MTHPKHGRDRHVPFIEHLRITRDSAEGGQATVSVELRPELLNNQAGGIIEVEGPIHISNVKKAEAAPKAKPAKKKVAKKK